MMENRQLHRCLALTAVAHAAAFSFVSPRSAADHVVKPTAPRSASTRISAGFMASPVMQRCQAPRMSSEPELAEWLRTEAAVSEKFMDKVLAVCDEEMIGNVRNLRTLQEAGILKTLFKPVIAASIEEALARGGDGGAANGVAASAIAEPPLPLSEVKRRLMAHGQDTWGAENELRRRLTMFSVQEKLNVGASWDSASNAWTVPTKTTAMAPTLTGTTAPPAVAPAAPSAPAPAPPKAAPAPAAAAPAAAAPAPAAPAPAAAAPAPAAAPPAADKDTFTVTLKTPDGELKFECPPDQFILDQTDEEEGDGFAELPYACRAGSCSACAGKMISGTADNSAGSFLSDEQKAAGFVLTCTTKPTSDCVIQTHMEEDLF